MWRPVVSSASAVCFHEYLFPLLHTSLQGSMPGIVDWELWLIQELCDGSLYDAIEDRWRGDEVKRGIGS